MNKIKFNKSVMYDNKVFLAGTEFEFNEKDKSLLVSMGGILIEETKVEDKTDEETKVEDKKTTKRGNKK